MSKAALIIDIPKNCWDCKLQDWAHCRITKRCHTGDTRPPWCPLCEVLDEYDVQAGYVESIRLKPKEE